MPFDLLVFDLDGTLIDSKLDLALAVNATRADAGLGDLPHEKIYTYVGNGAPMLIRRALGPEASDEQAERSLLYFYAYYREHMLDNTALYPGVRESLDHWHGEGTALAVLTNKPVRFSREIIDGLGLAGHFRQVYGGNSFDSKKPDPFGLRLVMGENGISAERTLMVGDSAVDVQTARNAGTAAAGVTYGLQPETFEEHPPDYLVDRMEELLAVTRNGHGPLPAPSEAIPLKLER
jgi:phosphoglycolate phosphatase